MPAGRLGQGSGLNNTSLESHIGGPVDGSPHILLKVPSGSTWKPTIVVASAVLNGVAVEPNHITKVLGRAVVMKRVNIASSGDAVWVHVIQLVGHGDEIDGKLLAVDDDGRGTIGQVGMNMEFEVPKSGGANTIPALTEADMLKPVVGAGNGMVMPFTAPATPTVTTLAEELKTRGKITRVIKNNNDNETGLVQVDLWL